jgi:diacylglycerol O-acyltransferase / wax synthase
MSTTPIPMLDLMFFLTESVENPRHVGSVLIFKRPQRGGANTAREIVAAYRDMPPRPPFNRIPVFRKVGMPVWQEVDRHDPNHHVLHIALPPPGTDQQLHEVIADLHAPMLERHRPGWKVYVIEGLARGRFAIYHKVHHALVDGESGMQILRRSLADSPRDREIRTTVGLDHPARPRPAPHGLRETLEGEARKLARRTLMLGRSSIEIVEETLDGLLGYTPLRKRAFTAPATPMNEPIYNARSISHTSLPLAALKAVAHATDSTLNDVALCLLDAAINRHLRTMGRTPDHPLVTICPVSLHDPGTKQATTNVSAIWPPLGPVSAPIMRRLEAIKASTREEKLRLKGLGKDAAYAYAVMAFALSETLTIARPEALGLLPANMLISNVRGPERRLYLNGSRLETFFPVSTLIAGVGLNITFMSYADQMVFGFTANGSALPEVESLARYTVEAFEGLQKTATRRRAARASRTVRGKARRLARRA